MLHTRTLYSPKNSCLVKSQCFGGVGNEIKVVRFIAKWLNAQPS